MASHESTTPSKYAKQKSICLNCGVEMYREGARKYCSYSCSATMVANLPKPKPLEERFWHKVDTTGDCWLWHAHCYPSGYGYFSIPRGDGTYRVGLAHRVAWQFRSGDVLEKTTLVCHTCDTPRCVRNDDEGWYEVNGIMVRRYGHLFIGTTQDNIADKMSKGRQRATRGMAKWHAKLTDDDIRDRRRLKKDGLIDRKIAAMYGVSQTTIHCLVRGIRWTHVLDEE